MSNKYQLDTKHGCPVLKSTDTGSIVCGSGMHKSYPTNTHACTCCNIALCSKCGFFIMHGKTRFLCIDCRREQDPEVY